MPGPNSSKAPLFNGETSELLEFFELFEDLASTYGLNSADKCKSLVRYVDRPTKRFWITLWEIDSRCSCIPLFSEYKELVSRGLP